jgi:hypothetical protein
MTVYGFDKDSFERVRKAVKRVEDTPRTGARRRQQTVGAVGAVGEESRIAIGVTTASFITGQTSGNSNQLLINVSYSTDAALVGENISIDSLYVISSQSIGVDVLVVAMERVMYASSGAGVKRWFVIERRCA